MNTEKCGQTDDRITGDKAEEDDEDDMIITSDEERHLVNDTEDDVKEMKAELELYQLVNVVAWVCLVIIVVSK